MVRRHARAGRERTVSRADILILHADPPSLRGSPQAAAVRGELDEPHYVGFRVGDQEIGLDPNDYAQGLTGPLAYWEVKDGEGNITGLLQPPS